jgi:hypothetical protein
VRPKVFQGKPGNTGPLRTTAKVLVRKMCGRTQTVFVVAAEKGTVVFVQITGKKQQAIVRVFPPFGGSTWAIGVFQASECTRSFIIL